MFWLYTALWSISVHGRYLSYASFPTISRDKQTCFWCTFCVKSNVLNRPLYIAGHLQRVCRRLEVHIVLILIIVVDNFVFENRPELVEWSLDQQWKEQWWETIIFYLNWNNIYYLRFPWNFFFVTILQVILTYLRMLLLMLYKQYFS